MGLFGDGLGKLEREMFEGERYSDSARALDAVLLAIAKGANAGARRNGETVLHRLAARGGADPEKLERIAREMGPSADAPRERDGRTALMIAAARKDAELARILLGLGADPLRKGKDGLSAREIAKAIGAEEALREIEAKLRPKGEGKPDADEALLRACGMGDYEGALDALAAGADPDARGESGDPALIRAARAGSAQIVSELLDRGADPEARGSKGRSLRSEALGLGDSASRRMLGEIELREERLRRGRLEDLERRVGELEGERARLEGEIERLRERESEGVEGAPGGEGLSDRLRRRPGRGVGREGGAPGPKA